jgi:hypothetical protein
MVFALVENICDTTCRSNVADAVADDPLRSFCR